MAGSKSDRKKNAKLDIFASNRDANDSVRVGYIDPKRGYVDGLSVYQANKYAERNPGTRFIFVTRDKIKYVNINQVNKLKNSDTVPTSVARGLVDENGEFDPCNTVRGFNTNPDGGEPEIKPDENLSFTSSGEYDAKDKAMQDSESLIKSAEEKIQQEIKMTEERVTKEKDLAISDLKNQLKDSATNFISKVTKIEKGNIKI